MCLAIPGKLLSVNDAAPLTRCGRVCFGGVIREVNLAFVPEANVDDYLLVHVGVAISVVDPVKAEATLSAIGGTDNSEISDEIS